MTVSRTWSVMVMVALAAGRARADVSPSGIDADLAKAAAADHALVIELGATWCKPCKTFATTILTRAEVRDQLRLVDLALYDLDTVEGEVVAKRYSVTVVPTFLVLSSRDGSELERVTGVPDATAFVALLARAPVRAKLAAELQSAVELHPDDAAARLHLADFERASGRTAEAMVHYREVVLHPNGDVGSSVRAHAAIEHLETAWELTRGLDAEATLVSHHLGTARASRELARLAVAHRLPASQLHAYAALHLSHLDPTRFDDLGDAVRAAILAGAVNEANATVQSWAKRAPHHPTVLLLAADLAMYYGNWYAARQAIEAACRRAPGGYELPCYARRIAIAGGEHALLPGIGHLATATAAALQGMPPDLQHDLEALGELDATFGRAVATAMLEASATCGAKAADNAIPSITFEPAAAGGTPHVVAIRDTHDAPLVQCLRDSLAAHVLPTAPVGAESLTLPIDVIAGPLAAPVIRDTPPRMLAPDVVAFAAIRTGAIETRGVGAGGLVDVARLDHARLVVEGQAEIGASDDLNASFAARALIGIGYVSSIFGQWSLAAGAGASRYGDMVPTALEMPFVARLGFRVGGLRCSLWEESVLLPTEPRRQEHRLGGDEISAGVGANVPVAGTHLFVGAEIENRVAGTTAVVLLGVPLFY